jgi:hypothetical protein
MTTQSRAFCRAGWSFGCCLDRFNPEMFNNFLRLILIARCKFTTRAILDSHELIQFHGNCLRIAMLGALDKE